MKNHDVVIAYKKLVELFAHAYFPEWTDDEFEQI